MKRLAVALISLALLAAPLGARAQQAGKVYRIGFLSLGSEPSLLAPYRIAFQQELQERGWIEGRDIVFEPRFAHFKSEQLPELVAEVLRLKIDVIVVSSTEAALAAKRATTSIPIVMTDVGDPVGIGLVASLARPGGNVTGLSFLGTEVTGKQLDLLKQAIPRLSLVGVLSNPANASHASRLKEAEVTADRLGVQLLLLGARSAAELDSAFASLAERRAGALLMLADPFFGQQWNQLVLLAVKTRLPTMYAWREHVVGGGLMSYGVNLMELYRHVAVYVEKILKGAKPGDLPVEQPTKFEFVINLKTAKALGLTIPPSVLARADEVIE
jgi:putative ABC transport system substrate-binding protein